MGMGCPQTEDLWFIPDRPCSAVCDRLIKVIPHKSDSDTIIGLNPDQLYKRFRKALRASGLPPFRFHDLRHYAASQMHANGVPDRYIEAIGGWKPGSSVLKRVYENVIDEERSRIEETLAKKNRFIVWFRVIFRVILSPFRCTFKHLIALIKLFKKARKPA